MPDIKQNYETLFILNATLSEEDTAAAIEKFKELISQNGEVTKVNEWGKRKLAYLIDDMSEGYYVLIEFTSSPQLPSELERVFNISENVLRAIVIRK